MPAADGPRSARALDDAERALAVVRAVLTSITAWERFDAGAELMLGELAGALGQMAAAFWLPRGEKLAACATWAVAGVDRDGFAGDLGAVRGTAGSGLVGYAWERRETVDEVPGALRSGAPSPALAATLALPCATDAEIFGVVGLYSTAPSQLSAHLMGVLAGAGRALGAFLARRRGELGLSPLSPREVEILTLAGHGLAVREIAADLGISPATVKTHLEHIYKKLGVRDRVAAVAHGLRTKIIE